MKTMMTPHLVAVGSFVRVKTQKGTDNTKRSVSIVKVEIDVTKAAVSILCSAGIEKSQYEATGMVIKTVVMHWEIVRATLMALMTYQG